MFSFKIFIMQIIAVSVIMGIMLPVTVNADNPCIPIARSTADPAPSVFNDTLYLYCTRDDNADLAITNIDCYATVDMINWIDYGPVLKESDVTWDNNAGHLWAPHVVYFGGKYHLYFPETSNTGTFYSGHATSSSPHGPFTPDPEPMMIDGSRTGRVQDNGLDPFVIMDTGDGGSGKNYLAWCITGITPNRNYIGELNEAGDAVTGTVELRNADFYPDGGHYVEGQWWIRANATWYHIYAVYYPGGAEQIACATTTGDLTGSYTFRGFLLGTNQNSAAGTIHPGCAYFRPQGAQNPSWYLFWHCGGEEFGGSLLSGNAMRSSGAEYFTFNGTGQNAPIISPLFSGARDWSLNKTYRGVGVPRACRVEFGDTIHVDRRSNTGANQYAIAGASVSRVSRSESDLGHVVSDIGSGAWVRYDSVNFSNFTDPGDSRKWKISGVRARVSATADRSIEVRQGDRDGKLLATIAVSNTGGLESYSTTEVTEISEDAAPESGIHNLTLVFPGGSPRTMNVNWIQFTSEPIAVSNNTDARIFSTKGFSCRRIHKNAFKINLPADISVRDIRLFNLKGQQPVTLITSRERGTTTVRFNAKTMACGSYVFKIKTTGGTFEHAFVY